MAPSHIFRSVIILTLVGPSTIWMSGCSRRGEITSNGSKDGEAETASPARRKPFALGPGETTWGSPSASSPGSGDAGADSAADVAGVRLNMTPEQAVAALKAFDPHLVLSKRYLTNWNVLQYGQVGDPEDCTSPPKFHLFAGIIAAGGTTFLKGKKATVRGGGGAYVGCGSDTDVQPGDEPETVSVYLSPQPGNHRVIGVVLWRKFKSPSTVAAVLAGASKKYPADVTAKDDTSPYRLRFWRFDARGRIMSETVAQQNRLLGPEHRQGGLPSYVHAGAGVGIDLVIQTTENSDVAQEFSTALYDEDLLFKFKEQAQAVYDDIHQKQLKEETEKAKKSAPPVKM